MSDSAAPWNVHAWLPCPSPTPRACSNSGPSSQCCHPTISSSAICFSSSFQSFPGSGSFPMSQFFTLGVQSIGASASASVLPVSAQGGFPLGLSGLISLLSKGHSRVSSSTTVGKHQSFGAQSSLWYPSLEKHLFRFLWCGVRSVVWVVLNICVLPFWRYVNFGSG